MIGARIRPLAGRRRPGRRGVRRVPEVRARSSGSATPAGDEPAGRRRRQRRQRPRRRRPWPSAATPAAAPRVFVAEDTGLTELEPNADDVPTAQALALHLDVAAHRSRALAYDLKRDDLYVGTADGTVAGVGLRRTAFHVDGARPSTTGSPATR